MVDPSGKWTSVVHKDWTFKIAIMAKIPEGEARTIAWANNNVDDDSKTTSVTLDKQQRKDWHFVSTERYIEALGICDTTLNAKEFGKYLHVIQDYFAHFSVTAMGGSSHWPDLSGKYAGIDDPYSNYHDWSKTMEMAQLTLDLMKEFQQRLMDAMASIAVSIAAAASLRI